MTSTASASIAPRRAMAVAVTCAVAGVGAVVAVAVVALVARAVGAPSTFPQLRPGTYIPLAVLGVVAGAVGWEIVIHRARDSRRTLSRLVPAVLILSFVPDVLLGVSGSPWGGVAALMVMHLAVAAVALPTYNRLLPPPARA